MVNPFCSTVWLLHMAPIATLRFTRRAYCTQIPRKIMMATTYLLGKLDFFVESFSSTPSTGSGRGSSVSAIINSLFKGDEYELYLLKPSLPTDRSTDAKQVHN